jgi:soluble lytic murein transglycosylase
MVKQAIGLMREGKTGEVTGIKKSVDDPVARKIVEWLILRHPSGDAGFGRYAAFIADNPSWPWPAAPARGRATVAGAE